MEKTLNVRSRVGYDDVDDYMDVSKANFLLSEASILPQELGFLGAGRALKCNISIYIS